jgi:hypothetical protein
LRTKAMEFSLYTYIYIYVYIRHRPIVCLEECHEKSVRINGHQARNRKEIRSTEAGRQYFGRI